MTRHDNERISHATCMDRVAYARSVAAQYPPGSEWRVLFMENAYEWLRLARYYR